MELIMKTGTNNVSKNMVLHLKSKVIAEDDVKIKLANLDYEIQQRLLWSAACFLWGYLVLMVTTAGMYASFTGEHLRFLVGGLFPVYLLMGFVVFYIWKGSRYKRSYFQFIRKTYRAYQQQKLQAQIKLIIYYLLLYTMLSITVCVFFSIQAHYSFLYLLKVMGPAHMITYCLGIHFIAAFRIQLRQLEHYHKHYSQLYTKHLNAN